MSIQAVAAKAGVSVATVSRAFNFPDKVTPATRELKSCVLKAIDLSLLPRAYGASLTFWAYPIVLILAVGTWRTHRRLASARDGPTA